MTEPLREKTDKPTETGRVKLAVGRVFLIYLLVGALLGVLSASVQIWLGIRSSFLGGAIVGVLVLLAPILNWLARSGYAPWLVRQE